jgi:dCMP deaminase
MVNRSIGVQGVKMRNKEKYMMDKAILASKQSYCKRKKVGALIVKDNREICSGYNGTISGSKNECEEKTSSGLVTKNTVVHAEANAISFAAKNGISTNNCSLYVTLSPCINCANLIIQSGIKNVFYSEDYRDSSGIEYLRENGILVEKYSIDNPFEE